MSEYVIQVPQYRPSFNQFFDLFLHHLRTREAIPIVFFFDELPLNPTSAATRRRLVRRGEITVGANGVLTNSGASIQADFRDDNLGLIRISFASDLRAKASVSADDGTITLDLEPTPNTPIAVEITPSEPLPIERRQTFFKLVAIRDHSCRFFFRSASGVVNELVATYTARAVEERLAALITGARERDEELAARYAPDASARGKKAKRPAPRKATKAKNDLSDAERLAVFVSIMTRDNACCGDGGDAPPPEERYVINRNSSTEICYIQKKNETPRGPRVNQQEYNSIQSASFDRDTLIQQGICRRPPPNQT